MNWTRSVRMRLTAAVTGSTAIGLAIVAMVAPGAVGRTLEDDLLIVEAESAYDFATFDFSTALTDEIVDVDTGEISDDIFGDSVSPQVAQALVDDQIRLLQAGGRFDDLIDAAPDGFSVPVGVTSLVDVAPNGTTSAIVGTAFDARFPVMSEFELDDYIVNDLALFETSNGGVVEITSDPFPLVIGVVEVDGLPLLVAADATSIELGVDRIRTIVWIAVPILTVVLGGIAWWLASRTLRPVRSITEQAATISGGTLDARVPVPATGDEVAELAATVNDMLDRLESDDRRRRRFVSDASHELRSPVAVMRNEAEVALAHPDDAQLATLAEAVAEESARLASIIDDLLALARNDEAVRTASGDVDLDDVVLAEAVRARRVPIDTSAVSAGRVTGRPDELGRLVTHLIDNAARHANSIVRVSLVGDADHVVLRVDDDGPGIAPAQRREVFERFTRLDEARTRDSGGAGLGLAVVAGIVERSGGTVEIFDAELGGASFVVSFPRPRP